MELVLKELDGSKMGIEMLKPGMRRLLILGSVFVILTLIAGVHMYTSFNKLLEMPDAMPSLNQDIPKGFWSDFGMIYYFSPIKTIGLTFAFYSLSLFVIQTVNKYWKE